MKTLLLILIFLILIFSCTNNNRGKISELVIFNFSQLRYDSINKPDLEVSEYLELENNKIKIVKLIKHNNRKEYCSKTIANKIDLNNLMTELLKDTTINNLTNCHMPLDLSLYFYINKEKSSFVKMVGKARSTGQIGKIIKIINSSSDCDTIIDYNSIIFNKIVQDIRDTIFLKIPPPHKLKRLNPL